MDLSWPVPRTVAAMFLYHASEYLKSDTDYLGGIISRDYNDRKAAQLLEAKADLLMAEARIMCWDMDLGFAGCQPEVPDAKI